MKFAITGATGYIGENLISVLKKNGMDTLALSRKKPAQPCNWMEYDLYQNTIDLADDISCVIHLAMNYDIQNESDQQREISAAQRLINASKKINARFIYLSSQTAAIDATTPYGQTKWKIEKLVEEANGIIIRPGMVYGGRKAGLYSQLRMLVKKLPCIPCFVPAPKVQPVHVVDLCESIFFASQKNTDQQLFCIASDTPIDFQIFLSFIATYNLGINRIKIPIPSVIINIGYKLFPNIQAITRLHSLFTLPVMRTANDISVLGLQLRSIASGLHPSGSNRRRLLLIEGFVLFSYLLGEKPKLILLKRYVKAIEALRNSQPIAFAKIFIYLPSLVAFLEKININTDKEFITEFQWRLNAATVLAEASVQGARKYIRLSKHNSFVMSVLICTKAVLQELVIRVISLLFSLPIKFLLLPKNSNQ